MDSPSHHVLPYHLLPNRLLPEHPDPVLHLSPSRLPAIRGYFCRPLPNCSPSPVHFLPVYNNESRELRPIEPLYLWKTPTVDFESELRNFFPGDVKSPSYLLQSLSQGEVVMVNSFIKVIKTQHIAYCKRHTELVRMMQEMENGMRRLEAEPKDWEKLGFDKIVVMPMFL